MEDETGWVVILGTLTATTLDVMLLQPLPEAEITTL